MKKSKKLLALLMSLAMIAAFVPAASYAEAGLLTQSNYEDCSDEEKSALIAEKLNADTLTLTCGAIGQATEGQEIEDGIYMWLDDSETDTPRQFLYAKIRIGSQYQDTSYEIYARNAQGEYELIGKTPFSTVYMPVISTSYKIREAISLGGTDYYGKDFYVKPQVKKVKITSARKSGKKCTIAWTKAPGAQKYSVYYKAAKGKAAYRTVSSSALKTTLKGLKKGKTYSIKVRGIYTDGYDTIYGSWSQVKKVKITK